MRMEDLKWLIPAIAFVVIIRVLMWRVVETQDSKARFRGFIGMFLAYTAVMCVAFWVVCRSALTVEECLERIMITFLIGNLIMLFVFILSYCLMEKREITEMDKIKLKDI